MKFSFLLGLVASLLLIGCGEKSDKSAGSLATAPVDYLKTAADSKHAAMKTLDTTSLNKAVELFNVGEGRYPNDLNELVEKKYIPQIPETPYGSKLSYDATTGKVAVVKE
jgi:hypothetical protein